MKTSHLICAALLGLAVGIPVASWMAAHPAQGDAVAEAAASSLHERKDGFSLQATVESRDPLGAIKTAHDFTALRDEAAARTGSPYRAVPTRAAAVEQLPLGEIIALLEAGELRGFDEIEAAFKRWLEADPLAAYQGLQGLPLADDDRRFARQMVFSHWARTQPEAMLGMLEKLPESEGKDNEAREFLGAWQKEDPGQALRFLDRLAGLGAVGADAAKIQADLLSAWMQKDAAAAERWVEALPPGAEKDALGTAMEIARLGQMKDAEAVQWISTHPEQQAAQQRLPEILGNWARSDPAAALARLAEFPADHPVWGYEASSIAQSAMAGASLSKSEESLAAAVNALPEGAKKRKLLLGLIEGASSGDFAMASRLLAGLPESAERRQAAAWFAESLARKDPAAASEWLLGLGASESRDLATDRFAATLAADRPALAAEWADSIEDPAWAAQARYVIYSRWHESDAKAAEQWRHTWPQTAGDGK